MRPNAIGLVFLAALLAAPNRAGGGPPAADLGPWKAVRKLRLPSPPRGLTLSEDDRLVLAICPEKRRRDSGGVTPGFVQIDILRCFDVDTGKEVFAKDMSAISPIMALKSRRLALSDTFDKVTVYDVLTWRVRARIDTRSPNDSPPGMDKGIPPELKDFGGGGRLGDIEFSADGGVLATARMETTGWKQNAKGTAFTAESFQRVTFWDADKGTKLGFLDCEDKTASNPHLSLLPGRSEMLVQYDNGVRTLDLTTRKWKHIFPVKDVAFVAVSPDAKALAVTDHNQGVKVFSLDTGKELLSFKERPVQLQPRLNQGLRLSGYQFAPLVQFVDAGKCLRVTLNDRRTVLYRDAATGAKVKRPASEALKFPGAPVRVLAVSQNRLCAVTTSAQGGTLCTVWQRGPAEKGKE